MKKLILLLAILSFTAAFTSCDKGSDEPTVSNKSEMGPPEIIAPMILLAVNYSGMESDIIWCLIIRRREELPDNHQTSDWIT